MDNEERAAFITALNNTTSSEELADVVIGRLCQSLDPSEKYIDAMELEEAKNEILDAVRESERR